ncbi:DUF411 domain-containing protein [Paludibacterium yongneupense]|uniref:DUF411 domain-containing protein n=1 Tax=Paludibacterium yongneupense TaxID=400061 RepID=UPI00048F4C33|nr:DUF411 domain-containing protein [Paludibacterium yongneupense]
MPRLQTIASVSLLLTLTPLVYAASDDITVYKNRGCVCCEKWSATLGGQNRVLHTVEMDDTSPIKNRYRVPAALRSCHSAVIGGYVFEGHVPSGLIAKVLRDRPAIAGLAVPGMPAGAPGMEVPGVKAGPWQVIAFERNGKTSLYAQR